MSTAEKLVTPEELAAMPDGDRYELVDGRLLEREMSTYTSLIGQAIYDLLAAFSFSTAAGKPLGDGFTFCCFPHDPSRLRKPDVSWFSASRWQTVDTSRAHIDVPPDLVVEVVSPTDNMYNVRRRVKDFLRAGTQEAWVVYPETQEIERRFPNGRAQWYEVDETLDGAPLLPGLSFKLVDALPRTTP